MDKINVSLEEQETTISLFPKQVLEKAEIYSCIPSTMNRLRKYAEQFPDDVKVTREDQIGIFVNVPASWVTIRRPRQVILSDEQRAAAAERLQAARQKKKGGEQSDEGTESASR